MLRRLAAVALAAELFVATAISISQDTDRTVRFTRHCITEMDK
jgi:hypothetical protein